MDNDVERAVKRSQRYWYDDGLVEVATGVVFAAIGLMFLAEAYGLIPPGVSSIGLVVIVFAGWWLAGKAVRAAKARITYPRTGYVRYRRPEGRRKSRWVTAAIAGGMGALIAVLFTQAPASLAWIPALNGVLVGAFILVMANNLGLLRFYALALLSAAIGIGISLAGLGDILGTGLYFLGTGIALALSGVFALVTYLRHTDPVEGE
jgi:hypothetical protein